MGEKVKSIGIVQPLLRISRRIAYVASLRLPMQTQLQSLSQTSRHQRPFSFHQEIAHELGLKTVESIQVGRQAARQGSLLHDDKQPQGRQKEREVRVYVMGKKCSFSRPI